MPALRTTALGIKQAVQNIGELLQPKQIDANNTTLVNHGQCGIGVFARHFRAWLLAQAMPEKINHGSAN